MWQHHAHDDGLKMPQFGDIQRTTHRTKCTQISSAHHLQIHLNPVTAQIIPNSPRLAWLPPAEFCLLTTRGTRRKSYELIQMLYIRCWVRPHSTHTGTQIDATIRPSHRPSRSTRFQLFFGVQQLPSLTPSQLYLGESHGLKRNDTEHTKRPKTGCYPNGC